MNWYTVGIAVLSGLITFAGYKFFSWADQKIEAFEIERSEKWRYAQREHGYVADKVTDDWFDKWGDQ